MHLLETAFLLVLFAQARACCISAQPGRVKHDRLQLDEEAEGGGGFVHARWLNIMVVVVVVVVMVPYCTV